MAWNRNEAWWWTLWQNFSKLIAIKSGFSGYYISTHAEAWFPLLFQQKHSVIWYFTWIFVQIYSCLCLLAYSSVTTPHITKCYHRIMHLPFVNLGAKSQPDSFDTHCVETLCLQHALARLSLILKNPRLFISSALPCYVSPMKLDCLLSLKSKHI